jgi:uncharacterized alkaline shock family protein YloU
MKPLGGDGPAAVSSPDDGTGAATDAGFGPPRARLDVSRSVVLATARLAAREVPGVVRLGRGGPPLRRLIGGRSSIRLVDAGTGLEVRLVLVARAGQPLGPLGRAVASAVRGAIERALGLQVAAVTVVVDGVVG